MLAFDNFVFDLYGTLIDIKTDEHSDNTWKKWCSFLDGRGILHPEMDRFRREFFNADLAYRKIAIDSGKYTKVEIDIIDVYRDLFNQYGNGILDDQTLNSVSYEFRVASREYMRLFPGVIEFLSMIQDTGKRAFILSNAQRSYTLPEIEYFDLHKLTVDQLISSDYKCMKPDYIFFDALIAKYSLDRSKTVMYGDTFSSDIIGARNSGISHVHLVGDNAPSRYYLEHLFDIV